MRAPLALWIIVSAPIFCAERLCGADSPQPLRLGEVLASTERSYPLLLAAIEERSVAEGKRLGAQGAFDAKFKTGFHTNQYGYYKNRFEHAKVEQPLRDWGAELFGGYKRGQGNFGPWEEDLLSLSGGEWIGGLRLPLLRGRDIDVRRTDLLLSDLAIELADASIAKQRLKLLETAAKLYWEWVAAGENLRIARELLKLAEQRADQIQGAVDLGELAAIEIVDNQRAILQRQSAVVATERTLQNAAYELSMFYRDDRGQPRTPGQERLADFPEPERVDPLHVEVDLARALEERPEVQATLVEQQQAQASMRLAENNARPAIDVSVSYSRDNGTGSVTKVGSEVLAGVSVETPFQRRKAKGDLRVQQAKLSQLDQKLRFARDRVSVEVLDAVSAIEAALLRLRLTREELQAARQLAEAERERLNLGDSTLFVVNLRELSAADAQLKVTQALSDYHKWAAVYRSATAGW